MSQMLGRFWCRWNLFQNKLYALLAVCAPVSLMICMCITQLVHSFCLCDVWFFGCLLGCVLNVCLSAATLKRPSRRGKGGKSKINLTTASVMLIWVIVMGEGDGMIMHARIIHIALCVSVRSHHHYVHPPPGWGWSTERPHRLPGERRLKMLWISPLPERQAGPRLQTDSHQEGIYPHRHHVFLTSTNIKSL